LKLLLHGTTRGSVVVEAGRIFPWTLVIVSTIYIKYTQNCIYEIQYFCTNTKKKGIRA
jgi:hypothetical protein